MAAPQQSAQGGGDHSSHILWIIAACFLVIGMVWYAFKVYLVKGFLLVKSVELSVLTFFTDTLKMSPNHFEQLRNTIDYAQQNAASVNFQDLMLIGNGVGDWLRFPLVLILLVCAFAVYFGNTTRIYRRTYTMQDLAKLEKDNWPQINPVIGLDLINQDIDKGPWAMAMTPMQFCKRYQILQEVRPLRKEGMARKDWDKIEVILKRGDANKIFALQLGQLWKGVDHLPPHTRALFAIFAARINADSEVAVKIIAQLSASSTTKLNLAGVDDLIAKHLNTKLVQKIVNSHAYVMTVMASMLEGARDDGVQASADFLWIKPIDRKLWYTLNTVGRQTPFIEVAGIFAHWIAEKEAARKLLVPMVEEATHALEIALKEVVYKPDEA